MRVLTGLMTLVFSVLVAVTVVVAQDPPAQGRNPTNLQVLPKDMTGRQVSAMMQNIRRSLGVQCDHCHVGGPADRAKDDNPKKEIARKMMRMVNNLNEMMGGTTEEPKVTCFTCHRGALKPLTAAPEGGGFTN
ncbi:MAG: c-type cytochrome [Vicinamibacterales bacterium]